MAAVDPKPLYYGATFLAAWGLLARGERADAAAALSKAAQGFHRPSFASADVADSIDAAVSDAAAAFEYSILAETESVTDPMDSDAAAFAASYRAARSTAALVRQKDYAVRLAQVVSAALKGVKVVYHGSEAALMAANDAIESSLFDAQPVPEWIDYARKASVRFCELTGSVSFINPSILRGAAESCLGGLSGTAAEALALAEAAEAWMTGRWTRTVWHAHQAAREDDVEAERFCVNGVRRIELRSGWTCYNVGGITYLVNGHLAYLLGADDWGTLHAILHRRAQSAAYLAMHDGRGSGRARTFLNGIDRHLGSLCVDAAAGKNFADKVRAVHICWNAKFMAFKDSHDKFDNASRAKAVMDEALKWDPLVESRVRFVGDVARDDTEALDLLRYYHCFPSDDGLISDLLAKVASECSPVSTIDDVAFADFIAFAKTYDLCRFMKVKGRKPATAGSANQLDEQWAIDCRNGTFTWPPRSQFGEVWIEGEWDYLPYADYYFLKAKDVSHVSRESSGSRSPWDTNELLWHLRNGSDVDYGVSPQLARSRVESGDVEGTPVVIAAHKRENNKPSAKKRATYAADGEFRAIQAEIDRNLSEHADLTQGVAVRRSAHYLDKQFNKMARNTFASSDAFEFCTDIKNWSGGEDDKWKSVYGDYLIRTTKRGAMSGIITAWHAKKARVDRMGVYAEAPAGSLYPQGMKGTEDTISHAHLFLYAVFTARENKVIARSAQTEPNVLIDDNRSGMYGCFADAEPFLDHTLSTYKNLGRQPDEVKTFMSSIRSVFLNRCMALGAELPYGFKTFIKADVGREHASPSVFDAASDWFATALGAARCNEDPLISYFYGCMRAFSEFFKRSAVCRSSSPEWAAAVAVIPRSNYGWGFPDILRWSRKSAGEPYQHFLATVRKAVLQLGALRVGPTCGAAWKSAMSLPVETAKASVICKDPFAIKFAGPDTPEMVRKSITRNHLSNCGLAEPWHTLMDADADYEEEKICEALCASGYLQAHTIAVVAAAFPSAVRDSVLAKAATSKAVTNTMRRGDVSRLRRSVRLAGLECAEFHSSASAATTEELSRWAAIPAFEATKATKAEFHAISGATVTDCTIPDPAYVFVSGGMAPHNADVHKVAGCVEIHPHNERNILEGSAAARYYGVRIHSPVNGLFITPKASSSWVSGGPHEAGWDPVTGKLAQASAAIAWAHASGHGVIGLAVALESMWGLEHAIPYGSGALRVLAGNIKRMECLPGSKCQPVFLLRNHTRDVKVDLGPVMNAFPASASLLDRRAVHMTMSSVGALLSHLVAIAGASPAKLKVKARAAIDVSMDDRAMSTGVMVGVIRSYGNDSSQAAAIASSCGELDEALRNAAGKLEALAEEDAAGDVDIASGAAGPSVMPAHTPVMTRVVCTALTRKDDLVPVERTVALRPDIGSLRNAPVAHKAMAVCVATFLTMGIQLRQVGYDDILNGDPEALDSARKIVATEDGWAAASQAMGHAGVARDSAAAWRGALRKLRIPADELRSEVVLDAHRLASWAGRHVLEICAWAASKDAARAGRTAADYERAPAYFLTSTNPAIANKRTRAARLRDLCSSNVTRLGERAKKLSGGKPDHRGDARAAQTEDGRRRRLALLRLRSVLWRAVKFDEELALDEVGLISAADTAIRAVAASIARRTNRPCTVDAPESSTHAQLAALSSATARACGQAGGHFFHDVSGRAVEDVISMFSASARIERVRNYYVPFAAAVAPVSVDAPAPAAAAGPEAIADAERDALSTIEAAFADGPASSRGFGIEAWKVLYCALVNDEIAPEAVEAAVGACPPANEDLVAEWIDAQALRSDARAADIENVEGIHEAWSRCLGVGGWYDEMEQDFGGADALVAE